MKLAANKGFVSALSCGKQLLRDFTGILTEGQCYQEVCEHPTPEKENMAILQNGRIQSSKISGKKVVTPISKEKKTHFYSELIGSLAAPADPLFYNLGKKLF